VERAEELEILAPTGHDFHENETVVSVGAAERGENNYLPMPILEYEPITQSTHLSRGNSGSGSVCDDQRHGRGVGNNYTDGGDVSGGQSRRTSSDGDSNGSSGGVNDNSGFAGICNVWLTLGRVVEWVASLLCLSHECGWRISQEHPLGWDRLDRACFVRRLLRAERAAELVILVPSVRNSHKNETVVSVGAAEAVGNNYLPIPILEYELIAQGTLLSRGDSGNGSVCEDKRHGSGVGNGSTDGGDVSGGQSPRTSSGSDSNGNSNGLKDSDGFNDDRGFAGICNGESVSDYDGGVRDRVNAVRGAAIGGSNSGSAGDIHRGGGVVTDIDSVEVDGAGNSQSDSCGGGCGTINTDDDLNGQSGLGSDDSERGGLEGIGLRIYRLKVQIWLLTCHMRQLKQLNYGIVVGLKTLKCELQRLKKAKRDVKKEIFGFYIDVSTTVIKSGFRTLRRLIRKKCEVEVSSAPDGQKVLAERANGAGWIAVEQPQIVVLFDQWKERSKRQTSAAVSRAARDVARNKHVNSKKEKKGGSQHGLPSRSHAGRPVFSRTSYCQRGQRRRRHSTGAGRSDPL